VPPQNPKSFGAAGGGPGRARYYPSEIIQYANTRGAHKVMYAGYFPMGLSLERIMAELPDVALEDEVWPQFLRENALRVFQL